MRETPLEVTTKYLRGIRWPSNKDEVLRVLERNGAPADVLEMLRHWDRDRVSNPNEVHVALWSKA